LNGVSFMWKVIAAVWEDKFQKLTAWKKQHGHTCVPISDPDLGSWVSKQRQSYKRGKLAPEKLHALNCIEFTWSTSEADWDDKFNQLCEWKRIHGHVIVPFNEGGLGWWSNTQRQSKRKGKLIRERELRLQEVGFVWNPSDRRAQSKKAGNRTTPKLLSTVKTIVKCQKSPETTVLSVMNTDVDHIDDNNSMSACSSDSFAPCTSSTYTSRSDLDSNEIAPCIFGELSLECALLSRDAQVSRRLDEPQLFQYWPVVGIPSNAQECNAGHLPLYNEAQPRTSADILRLMMM
jgi:hypothetical protein